MLTDYPRDRVARMIENDLKKYAGVIRNLILEGKSYTQARKDPRAKFWTNAAHKSYSMLTE